MPAPQLHLFDPHPRPSSATSEKAPDETMACGYWDFCPNCGHRLHNQRCKYRCPRCHYFMSCSDFD